MFINIFFKTIDEDDTGRMVVILLEYKEFIAEKQFGLVGDVEEVVLSLDNECQPFLSFHTQFNEANVIEAVQELNFQMKRHNTIWPKTGYIQYKISA